MSRNQPIKGGAGEYLNENYKLSSGYASSIAAIMYNEGLINYKGKGKIELKRI